MFGPLPAWGELPPHAAPTGAPATVAEWKALTTEQQHAINATFANLGKAIAAFERTIAVPQTRFDDYAAALAAQDLEAADKIFTAAERNGLKLFMGDADCGRCHRGVQFTDMKFYNLGLPGTNAEADNGRKMAAHQVKDDIFNCLGPFSDAKLPFHCAPLKQIELDTPEQLGAFKSPSLRGVGQRPPFMHNGKFATLHDVLVHYNAPPNAPFGTSDLPRPRNLTAAQLDELEAFLRTLDVKP